MKEELNATQKTGLGSNFSSHQFYLKETKTWVKTFYTGKNLVLGKECLN
jgi:dihydrofolate reductase